jgi:phospholipase C
MLGVAVAVLGAGTSTTLAAPGGDGPSTRTPIKHFVTLMQENHTFDNYFGTRPGVDGIPAGTCMPVSTSQPGSRCVRPFHIGNRPVLDLGHNEQIFVDQFNGGRMNGFVEALRNSTGRIDPNVMGYYDDRDLPYYWNLADEYVLFDRFFTSASAGSLRNHMYWVTGTPGNYSQERVPENGFDKLPTIFDRLQEQGISWKFYIQNYDPQINLRNRAAGDRSSQVLWAPVLNYRRYLDDPKLNSRIVDLEQYYEDLANDSLPAVSYIVPSGASEHPPGSIQAGERFIRRLINSLMRSRFWSSSAFMWTYDGWGGWYDHVRPPQVDAYGFGFRAPALLVSPYAKRGYVDSTTLDFTSMLKFIEGNWDLKPLASRDRKANTFMKAFNFAAAPRPAKFLSNSRESAAVREPRRIVIYVAYSWVVLLAAAMIGFAVKSGRRRRATASPGAR